MDIENEINADLIKAFGEPEGEPEPKQDGETGEPQPPSDPLANLSVDDIIKHPILGKQLQSRTDQISAKQVQSALERERAVWSDEAKLMAEAERFKAMTEEELGSELNSNPSSARTYAELIRRTDAAQDRGFEDKASVAGELASIAQTIHVYSSLVNESDLTADEKAKLDPVSYKDQGLAAYQSAVFRAFVSHEAKKVFEKELKGNLDVATQERLAEIDPRRPVPTSGAGPKTFDIMTTPAEDLITFGLTKRNGGKK